MGVDRISRNFMYYDAYRSGYERPSASTVAYDHNSSMEVQASKAQGKHAVSYVRKADQLALMKGEDERRYIQSNYTNYKANPHIQSTVALDRSTYMGHYVDILA